MSGFDSPSFKKNIPTGQQRPLREYTVGSEDDFSEQFQDESPRSSVSNESQSDVEERFRQARKEKLQNLDKISDGAKKRIEILASIGRLTKDVQLDEYLFSIRTLKSKEMRDATLASLDVLTNAEASFEIKRQILARSIYKIDNNDIKFIIGDDKIETKLIFIDDLEEVVINKLYDEFQTLRNEVKAKYSITSEQDAKEVAEELKK